MKGAENSFVNNIYYDKESVKKTNSDVTLWILFDYREPQKGRIGWKFNVSTSSTVEYTIFDCASSRFKILSRIFYSGPMQTGEIHGKDKHTDWTFAVPNSFNYTMLRSACEL